MTDTSNTSASAAASAATSELSGKSGEAALKASSENLPPKSSEPDTDFSVSPETAKKLEKANKDVADGNVTKVSRRPRSKNPAGAKGNVYGKGETDEVFTSRLVFGATARKSLSVKHLQRRLAELGYPEAASDVDGYAGALTQSSVSKWQEANDFEVGALTAEQAKAIFDNDSNVTVVVDTIEV